MEIFSNRSFAAPRTPALSMARDVVRIVITAVLAGTGFAVLLALAILSLTVITPPAHASGTPPLASSEPDQAAGPQTRRPGEQSGGSLQGEVFAAQALPANVPQGRSDEGVSGSQPRMASVAGWSLILALLAGALGLIVYARRKPVQAQRKS